MKEIWNTRKIVNLSPTIICSSSSSSWKLRISVDAMAASLWRISYIDDSNRTLATGANWYWLLCTSSRWLLPFILGRRLLLKLVSRFSRLFRLFSFSLLRRSLLSAAALVHTRRFIGRIIKSLSLSSDFIASSFRFQGAIKLDVVCNFPDCTVSFVFRSFLRDGVFRCGVVLRFIPNSASSLCRCYKKNKLSLASISNIIINHTSNS